MAEPIMKEKSAPAVDAKPKKTVSVKDIMSEESAPKVSEKPAIKSTSKSKPSSKSKGKHKHTHIEHHDDGSHTVRHSGDGNEMSYATPDLEGVKAGLDQHIGGGQDPTQTAAQPDAGGAPEMPGAPAAAAPAPAAQPMMA